MNSWQRVVMLALFIGGGVGLIALGQPALGAALLGAASGAMVPTDQMWKKNGNGARMPNPPTTPKPNGWIKIESSLVAGVLAVGVCLACGFILAHDAKAVTVQAEQNVYLNQTGGLKLNGVSCTAAAANRWTGWVQVNDQHSLAMDIDLAVNVGAPAYLEYRCETSQANTTVADAGRDLPVVVATAATGISTAVPQWIMRFVGAGGGAPGTFGTSSRVSNIPAPWINCLFTCGAGANVDDTITVYVRGNNP